MFFLTKPYVGSMGRVGFFPLGYWGLPANNLKKNFPEYANLTMLGAPLGCSGRNYPKRLLILLRLIWYN